MARKIYGLLLCLFLLTTPLKAHQYKLSICTIFQNEAPYLKEWIEFHRLVGVEHFYLFNNLSTDHYREVLKPYIKAGVVELIDWPHKSKNLEEWDKIQIASMEEGLRLATGKTKWLAFLDTDEFLFSTQCDSLVEFLKPFESLPKIGGTFANWIVYGTSHVAKIPDDKLLIETLVLSNGSGSDHVKSIVRPEKISEIVNPHYMRFQKGYSYYTPNERKTQPPFKEIEIDRLRINHYWSRDQFYLNNVKIPRRLKWGTSAETCQLWESANNHFYDTSIFRFIEPLRAKVFKSSKAK